MKQLARPAVLTILLSLVLTSAGSAQRPANAPATGPGGTPPTPCCWKN